MAITSAICTSFKVELLKGVHDFSDVSFTSASFTANGALIYNSSASGNPACAVIAFGSAKTVTSGTFTIQFPTADATNAIIRIA